MTALHWAARARRSRTDQHPRLRRRQRRGGDAHRSMHAAPHRRPRWQRPGRQDADRRPCQRGRGELAERRDGTAPRRQLRQRRGSPPPARCQVGRQREGTRVGPDAAHLRRLAEPRRDHQAPDVARRRRQDHQQVDRPRQGRPARSRGASSCSEKFSTPPWPRARSRPPARFRRRSRPRANCCCRGRCRLPRRVQPTPRSSIATSTRRSTRRSAPRRHDRLAVRQGYVEAARALIDGGADVNQVTAGDSTAPLLMASINGQFDAAMLLIEKAPIRTSRRRAIRCAALGDDQRAVAAAYASRSRSRWSCRRPAISRSWKRCSRPAPIRTAASSRTPGTWSTGCGNRNCGLADNSGSTPFLARGLLGRSRRDEALAKYGADANIPTMAPQQAVRAVVAALRVIEAVGVAASPPAGQPGAAPQTALPGAGAGLVAVTSARAVRWPRRQTPIGRASALRFHAVALARSRFTPPLASSTAKASPATPIVMLGRLDAGDEVSRRRTGRRRQRA